jgi:hypothetical protein
MKRGHVREDGMVFLRRSRGEALKCGLSRSVSHII